MSEHAPIILIEIVLIFGGALAFAWWQFRDLDREKRKKQVREQEREQARAAQLAPDEGRPDRGQANGHAS